MTSTYRFAIVGLCVATASVLALIAYQAANPTVVPQQAAQSTPAPLQTSYLVASHRLAVGVLTRDEDVTSVSVRSTDLPPGVIIDTPEARANLRGAFVRNYIEGGSPIASSDVLRPRDYGFLAAVLHPGTRAVSIGVTDVSGVSGLIWPGDHVDVILTQVMDKDKSSIGDRTLSETVLHFIRVIAVDQEIVQGTPTNNTAAGKLTKTVTVEVDPAQAEKISVAMQLGKLSLSICPAVDAPTAQQEAPTFASDVSRGLAKTGRTMKVVSGEKVAEYSFP